MPLVVMCGYPSSGKTKRSEELKVYLQKHHPSLDVVILNDGGIDRNEVYEDSKKEIIARGALKSGAERHLTNNNVVILDSLNYVKGFRYELHCIAKYARSTHCLIHCDASKDDVSRFNNLKNDGEKYMENILEALIFRFEAPNSMARWDSPLFTVQVADELPCPSIYQTLFGGKMLKPNMSTQNPPLMSPSFIYEADKVLQSISGAILAAQKTANLGDTISLPNTEETYTVKEKISVGDMRRQRKQFLTYLRANPVSDVSQVPKTFIYFLSS